MGVASAAALLLARRLDRPAEIGFYLVGAGILGIAFVFSAADTGGLHRPNQPDHADREYRVRASLIWVLVGAVVLAIGIALELT